MISNDFAFPQKKKKKTLDILDAFLMFRARIRCTRTYGIPDKRIDTKYTRYTRLN